MQDSLHKTIDKFIEANRAQLVEDLAALIAIRSVEGQPALGAPFGEGPRRALDKALEIARRMGLVTNDGDGYTGWAEVKGRSEDYIATVTHLDVVPEGDGWDADPYTLREKDGWLLGRGVEDDKGPSILCLYAAKFLLENCPDLPHSVRVLLGCQEETGMSDIPYYLAHNPAPLFAFSPDTEFPVCNGEKGHLGARFISPRLAGNLLDMKGGIAGNVIPDRATATVKGSMAGLAETQYIKVRGGNGALYIEASGVGGHAAKPAGTVNAIGQLVDYLLENSLCTEAENEYLRLLQKLHHATDGSLLGVDATDPAFDPLTIIGGVIEMQEGVISQHMDSRYTPTTSAEKMADTLGALAAKHGAGFELYDNAVPFYIPADSAPIRALMETYNEVSGKNEQPYTMGGGTYARLFPRAVSFGPAVKGAVPPEFVGAIHGANEGISLASMLEALKIYIISLIKLQEAV